ncbi:MAG: twin-arginine translocase subunit TatC, partial [Pseudooceanicola sp.]
FVVVYGLYEISIHLVRRVERQREARLRAEGAWFDDEDFEEDEDEEEAAAAAAEPDRKDD